MQFRNLVENQHKKTYEKSALFKQKTGIIISGHQEEKGIKNLVHFEYILQEEKHRKCVLKIQKKTGWKSCKSASGFSDHKSAEFSAEVPA